MKEKRAGVWQIPIGTDLIYGCLSLINKSKNTK
jgi:hypothetical protein